MPFASFNPAHEKHTKKSDNCTRQGAESVCNQVSRLKGTSEMRLAEFDGISAQEGKGNCPEDRHEIQDDDSPVHRIVETNEKQEAQGSIGQKVSALVLSHHVRNRNIRSEGQVDYHGQTYEAKHKSYNSHCP